MCVQLSQNTFMNINSTQDPTPQKMAAYQGQDVSLLKRTTLSYSLWFVCGKDSVSSPGALGSQRWEFVQLFESLNILPLK